MGGLLGGAQSVPTFQNTLQNINQQTQQQQQQDYATAQAQQQAQQYQQQYQSMQNQATQQAFQTQANELAQALGANVLGNAQNIGQGGVYPGLQVAQLNPEQLSALSGLYGSGIGLGQSLLPAGVGYLGAGANYLN